MDLQQRNGSGEYKFWYFGLKFLPILYHNTQTHRFYSLNRLKLHPLPDRWRHLVVSWLLNSHNLSYFTWTCPDLIFLAFSCLKNVRNWNHPHHPPGGQQNPYLTFEWQITLYLVLFLFHDLQVGTCSGENKNKRKLAPTDLQSSLQVKIQKEFGILHYISYS